MRRTFRALILGVSLAVVVTVGFRRTRWAFPENSHGTFWVGDPDLGFRARPWRTFYNAAWGRSTVRTGEFGRRLGAREPVDLSAATVLCVGDSTTFCAECDDEDTWPSRLEALRPDVSVVNAGVGGYSTVQSWLASREWLARLPALKTVVYAFCANDLRENLFERGLEGEPTARREGGRLVLVPCGAGARCAEIDSPEKLAPVARAHDGVGVLAAILREWRLELEARGVRLIVLRVTDRAVGAEHPDVTSLVSCGGPELREACEAAGAVLVDPSPLLVLPPESYHAVVMGQADFHLSVVAHAAFASALEPCMPAPPRWLELRRVRRGPMPRR